jgi:predicted nucleotidyltransferase
MIHKKELLEEIKSVVGQLRPLRAIVFGSFAYGIPHKDSDLDILVILNKSGISKNYSDLIKNRHELSKLLRDIRKRIPIDLLVYTKDEWEYIKNSGSSFYKNIEEHGITII